MKHRATINNVLMVLFRAVWKVSARVLAVEVLFSFESIRLVNIHTILP